MGADLIIVVFAGGRDRRMGSYHGLDHHRLCAWVIEGLTNTLSRFFQHVVIVLMVLVLLVKPSGLRDGHLI